VHLLLNQIFLLQIKKYCLFWAFLKNQINHLIYLQMNRVYALLVLLFISTQTILGQCTLTNATSCTCLGGGTNCDLLPDITVSRKPLTILGSSGVIEYSQSGNGANNGRLRISVTTPNIGHGPMETRSSNVFVCGTDTFIGTAPTICPDNVTYPKIIINQRVYHKNGNVMSYYDRPAGTMTYHPTHGHQHVDNWGVYTLRTATNDPNPLNWPIVGNGAKLAFCLLDIGACASSGGSGLCISDNGDTLDTPAEFYGNYGLGGGSYGCSATLQGISTGYYDTYNQSLDGMWINIPPGTCNGNYYIVCQQDPDNFFLEENDNNNVIAVPFTLTQQGGTVPMVSTSGPTTFCAGGSVTLTCSAASDYLWSNGATTQSITVTQGGTYTCTVNNTSACATTSAPVTVTVNSFPVTVNASSVNVCSGSPVQLSASATGNGVTNVVQNFSNSTVYSIPDNNATGIQSAVTVSGINPATLSSGVVVSVSMNITHTYDGDLEVRLISPSNQSILLSNRRGGSGDNFNNTTFSMTASTPIASGSAPFSGTYIPDGSLNTFTGNVNGSWKLHVIDRASSDVGTLNSWTLRLNNQVATTISYNWTSTPSGFSSSSQNPTANPAQTTTYTVTASESGTGCAGSNSVTVNVANPNVAISGNNAICPGENTTLTASGAASYQWSPATGLSATTGSTVVASPSVTTTYTVTGTLNGCTDVKQFTVTVKPLPTITTSGNVAICEGQSAQLTASGASGYVWTPSTGLNATTGGNVTASPVNTTTYTVTGTTNGCSADATITVVVNANPVMQTSGDVAICSGEFVALTASGATTYSWSPATALNTTTGANVTANPTATLTYTVTGTTNGCSATASLTVTVNAIPVVNVSANTTSICTGQSATLTASGANTYVWSPSTGLNSTTGATVIANPTTTTTYTVTGYSAAGCFATNNITINSNTGSAPPMPGAITGNKKPCPANNETYSVAAVTGAVSYNWTVPAGVTIINGQGTNSITVSFNSGFSTGNLSVAAVGNCGVSALRSATIAKDIPTTPASISGPVTGLCNAAGTFTSAAVTGATGYTWTVPAGVSITGGQGTTTASIYVSSAFVSGSVCVTADNACMSSTARCVTIKKTPSNPTTLTGPATVCAGQQNVAYATTTVFGATAYNWVVPSGSVITSGQGTMNITTNFGTKTGNVAVTAVNACGSSGSKAQAVTFNCRLGENNTAAIQLSPNPTENGITNLVIESKNNGIALIKLTDILGNVVLIKNLANTSGINNHKLDLSKFNKGIYLLNVDTGIEKQTLKVVLQ
jgi:subtilisin-like proprotein convertase family protein